MPASTAAWATVSNSSRVVGGSQLVGLNKSEPLSVPSAGFRADPDLIEQLRQRFRIVAEQMKPVVPLGVFDNHGNVGIDLFRRFDENRLCQLGKQLSAVLAP